MMQIIDYGLRAEPDRLTSILNRGASTQPQIVRSVGAVIEAVRTRGDAALVDYTREFDGVEISPAQMRVRESDIEAAHCELDRQLLGAIRVARDNITRYHEAHRPSSWWLEGEGRARLGKRIVPIDRVGIYIPGGSAPLISTVLMAGVPARVAGVQCVVLATPPRAPADGVDPRAGACSARPRVSCHPGILAAAHEVGISEIYLVGGAQAIAALAVGTETVPRVDKIVGPGNSFVVEAKRQLAGQVGIESLPGPSEVVVIADGSARPAVVASDLISQAEHGPDSVPVCIATGQDIASRIDEEVTRQIEDLPRKHIATRSFMDWGAIVVVGSVEEAICLSNRIAPEHLVLAVTDPEGWLGNVRNAGAVFLGDYSPVAVGDFICGTNHILPTAGTARFSSSLGVRDFVKEISVVSYTLESLLRATKSAIAIAEAEGLSGHAWAIQSRSGLAERLSPSESEDCPS